MPRWAPIALVALSTTLAVAAPTLAAPPDPPPSSSLPPTPTTEPPTTVAASSTTTAGPSTTSSTTTGPTTDPGSTTSTAPAPTTTAAGPTTTARAGAATTTTAASTTTSSTTTTAPDGGPVLLAEPGAGTLGLSKRASVPDVSPGESFNYSFVATCSGLERSCINATLTDTIPADLVILADELQDTEDYVFTVVGNTVTVRFVIPLSAPNPPGSVGIPDGAPLAVTIPVRLPPESQVLDGTVLPNTATITATGSDDVTASATVPVVVPRVVTPVARKTWADGSSVAGTNDPSTITLGIRNASSSSAEVTSLTVEDSTANTFEKFDVTGLGAVTYPAGADRVVVLACTQPLSACADDLDWVASPTQSGTTLTLPDVPAADITGLRFVFFDAAEAPLPYDATGGSVAVDVVLRDTIRSSGATYSPSTNDVVSNCATPSATDPVADEVTGANACVNFTVYPAQATIGVAKSFFSDTNGDFTADGRAVIDRDSPVSALTRVTNTSPFPVESLTITEPSATSPNELSKVDITDLRIVFPAGATTAAVEVDCGAGYAAITGSPFTAPPTTIDRPTGCADALGVRVTFIGEDVNGDGAIATNAVAQLGVRGTLDGTEDDTDVTNGPGAGGDGIANCASATAVSSIGGVGAAAGNACAVLPLWVAYSDLTGVKSAQLPSILPGLPRLFTLSFTNSGTIPATDVVMADPVDPTAPGNAFDTVRLADLVLPATPAAIAEVFDPDVGDYVPYVATDAALLERSRGFRVILPTVAPGQTYSLQFNVYLRDGLPAGTVFRNCAGVGSDAQLPAGFCSQDLTVGALTDSAALEKQISPPESVRPQAGLPGSPAQIRLTLQNTGTLFLKQLVATDADPAFFDAVDLTGAVNVNFPPGSDRVRVDACTGACGPDDWTLGTVTASRTPSLPVPPADARGVRVTFTAVPVSTPSFPDGDPYRISPGPTTQSSSACNGGATICIGFTPRVDLRSAPGTPVPDVLVDTASGGYESRNQVVDVLAPIPGVSSSHTLTAGTAELAFSKSPDRTSTPGAAIPFILRTENTGTGPIPNLTVVEPLPAELEYAPVGPDELYVIADDLPAGSPPLPTPIFTQVNDPVTGKTTSLRWEFPGWDLLPGAIVRIQVRTVLAPGVVAGDVIENRAGATGDRDDLGCSTDLVPRPGVATDDPLFGAGQYCTSGAEITTGEGNAFRTQKWVAGDPSLGFLDIQTGSIVAIDDPGCPRLPLGGTVFTRFPCVARVLPGNGFDFYLQLTNSGTNPATEVRLVDVFPAPGDTGVILTGQSRGTEWNARPTLLSPVALTGKGSADIDYTTATPACTADLALPVDACGPDAFPLGYSSSATAFRAVVTFAGDLLLPGQTTGLRFRMAAPADPADATDDVAWNSFAHTDFFQSPSGIVQLPPTEPIKTGVAIVYGGLTIAKTLVDPDGAAAGLEFVIEYECSVTPEGGDPVVVVEGTVTLAGGEQGAVPGVPAGATCLVWEPDAQGLVSNAPSRDEALSITIPIDGTVGSATVEVVNTTEEELPPTTTVPGPTTTAAPGTSTTTTVPPSGVGGVGGTAGRGTGTLPATGSDAARVLATATLLVGLGAMAIAAVRRRRA